MMEPELRRTDLRGAIRFFDSQQDDARFCLDNLLDADQQGARLANYCEVTGFETSAGRLAIAAQVCRSTSMPRLFPSAPGHSSTPPDHGSSASPIFAAPDPAGGVKLRGLSPTKGVHILLPRLTQSHAIFFQGRRDSRMMFVLPWNDCTMVGTTDTDFQGDPADARANPADIEYLLHEAHNIFSRKANDSRGGHHRHIRRHPPAAGFRFRQSLRPLARTPDPAPG